MSEIITVFETEDGNTFEERSDAEYNAKFLDYKKLMIELSGVTSETAFEKLCDFFNFEIDETEDW